MEKDIILERAKEGKCPIGGKSLEKDFYQVFYKGEIIKINKKYHCPKKFLVKPEKEAFK